MHICMRLWWFLNNNFDIIYLFIFADAQVSLKRLDDFFRLQIKDIKHTESKGNKCKVELVSASFVWETATPASVGNPTGDVSNPMNSSSLDSSPFALRNISFSVSSGDLIAVIGSVGSGYEQ